MTPDEKEEQKQQDAVQQALNAANQAAWAGNRDLADYFMAKADQALEQEAQQDDGKKG